MNRRNFLKMAGAGMAGALLPGIAKGSGEATEADEKPNLLVIMTDEFNFRTLGCYRALLRDKQAHIWGPEAIVETPHIDSIARRGALCNRFYCASPVCTPSRASFFTGLYPQSTGADLPNAPLRDDMVTFAKVLRKNGYSTGYAGKWHLDGPAKPGWAPERKFGFDDNTYMFNRGHWKMLEDTDHGPDVKSRAATGEPDYGLEGADEQSYTTDFLADKTVEFIRANQANPFCFVLSLPDPHNPMSVRAPYDTMYLGMPIEKPNSAPDEGEFEDMAQYFGMIKCIDDNVGKILEALQAAGLAKRTIIVFTADHGEMGGQRGKVDKGPAYEDSVRTPFMIKCPGRIRPLTVVNEAMNSTDFKPTILSLMGIRDTRANHGHDKSSILKGAAPTTGRPDITFSRNAYGRWLMAADSRHKLVVNNDSDPEFYDTHKDSSETRNLVYEEASHENIRRLGKALLHYCSRFHEPIAAEPRIQASMQWAAQEEWKPYSWHPPRWG